MSTIRLVILARYTDR